MSTLLFTCLLLLIGVIFGTAAKKKHLKNMHHREDALSHLIVTNLKTLPPNGGEPMLVTGSVVIAFDYFRRVVAQIIMLFGGRNKIFENMLDRARREALLRLLENAEALGASQIHNVRFEFSRVGGAEKGIGGGAELFAYGTAVR